MDDDLPVFVVDVRKASLAADADAIATGREAPPLPPDAPLDPDEPIATVAILHDGSDAPLLLDIPPTRDRDRLDAIARLVRFAVLRRMRTVDVALQLGGERERRWVFERALPGWMIDGLSEEAVEDLPDALQIAFARPRRGRRPRSQLE